MILFIFNLIGSSLSLFLSKHQFTASPKSNRVLVVYFSCSGNTKRVATNINSIVGGDLIEIIPKEPNTNADLNYNNDNSRVVKEHNDQSILPEISGNINNFQNYETIYLGYQLWWGQAPSIIRTFMKKYEFANKNIITFCTSISTSTDTSKNVLPQLAPNAKFNDKWQRFSSSASTTVVCDWIDGLALTPRILIAYFSAQGHTKKVAEIIKNTKIADLKARIVLKIGQIQSHLMIMIMIKIMKYLLFIFLQQETQKELQKELEIIWITEESLK